VQLLGAIKGAFEARGKDRIISAGLVIDLVADETAPWATYNKGKPISQRQVANLLKAYGIKPKVIKLDDGSTARGYLLEWFTDVFSRFYASDGASPPSPSVTNVTDLFSKDFSQFSSVTGENEVTDRKDGKAFENNEVTEVTDRNRGPGEKKHVRTARSRSDDLPYDGPVVEVPDQGPDPLNEHGEPVAVACCAYCGRPGGNRVALGDGIEVRLHRDCEDAYITRRTGEEGIAR
jgi:hypothetical protein